MGEMVITRWSGIHPLHRGSFLGPATTLEKFSVPQQIVFPSWEHPSLFNRYTISQVGAVQMSQGQPERQRGRTCRYGMSYGELKSMGFSRQEYWSWLPCSPPRDLLNPRIEPVSPALQINSLPLSHWGSPKRQ